VAAGRSAPTGETVAAARLRHSAKYRQLGYSETKLKQNSFETVLKQF